MKYVPIPIAMLEVGKPLPVDVWNPDGRLLLRKGQPIVSEQHREKLYGHNASTTAAEAQAWQRAYERMIHDLLQQGVDVELIARMPMPSVIYQRDHRTSEQLKGGWLDLQEVLRGILYQGGLALDPVQRLMAIENKARSLLKADADDSLFRLFQALADNTLGYCATHALLCAAVCELAGEKLGLDLLQRQSLMGAALTMNIGMAREQDGLARQDSEPSAVQRLLIQDHPKISLDILTKLGVDDFDLLDIVRWHHEPEHPEGQPYTLLSRQLLKMTDAFVAMTAARATREARSPLEAAKAMYLQTEKKTLSQVSSALAAAVGFYPPGSYVRLVNGETAVSVQRGARANTPWVIGIADPTGVPALKYTCRDTSDPAHAIAAPVVLKNDKISISAEKVRLARDRIPGSVKS
jgi:HD-GYP domain-containing protein (c-di-GMP phosphodiesterase class II)